MHLDTFEVLHDWLINHTMFGSSKHVSSRKKLVIFLWMIRFVASTRLLQAAYSTSHCSHGYDDSDYRWDPETSLVQAAYERFRSGSGAAKRVRSLCFGSSISGGTPYKGEVPSTVCGACTETPWSTYMPFSGGTK